MINECLVSSVLLYCILRILLNGLPRDAVQFDMSDVFYVAIWVATNILILPYATCVITVIKCVKECIWNFCWNSVIPFQSIGINMVSFTNYKAHMKL